MSDVETRWTEQELALSRVLHRAVDDASPASPPPTAARPFAAPVDLGRRRWAVAAVPALAACVVTALVVGIGLATRDEPAPAASPPAPVLQDPGVLRGTWSADVVSTEGDDDLTVRARADSMAFSDQGCSVSYSTATHPDGLVAVVEGVLFGTGKDPCAVLGSPTWTDDVGQVSRFVVQDLDHVVLLDRSGRALIALTRRGTAAGFAPAAGVAALPAGLVPPSPEQLLGSWFQVGDGSVARSVHFETGTWTYSQSLPCNSRSQPYSLSVAGGFATVRVGGLQGCDPRLPGWLAAGVARVGLDGEILVLLDADGEAIARLERDAPAGDSLLGRVQGEWTLSEVGARSRSNAWDRLWLRIEDEWLRHAFNASCNTADDELRLSGDGWVIGHRRTQEGGCEPAFDELVPRPVERVALDGDELVLSDSKGDEIVRLVRADP